jgi:hypothetical protein
VSPPPNIGVPQWARDAVWYQVFPERSRNGCPASSPRAADVKGGGIPGWSLSPWGGDWYRRAPWETGPGDSYRNAYDRRFGGDLAALAAARETEDPAT